MTIPPSFAVLLLMQWHMYFDQRSKLERETGGACVCVFLCVHQVPIVRF